MSILRDARRMGAFFFKELAGAGSRDRQAMLSPSDTPTGQMGLPGWSF